MRLYFTKVTIILIDMSITSYVADTATGIDVYFSILSLNAIN